MSVSTYKELVVWQKSFELVKSVYELTAQLPNTEKYCLSDQARRCAVSMPSNIAEGQQRHNTKEFRQFLGIARGSAGELETQVLLIQELYKLNVEQVVPAIHEIQKMLHVLAKKLADNQ